MFCCTKGFCMLCDNKWAQLTKMKQAAIHVFNCAIDSNTPPIQFELQMPPNIFDALRIRRILLSKVCPNEPGNAGVVVVVHLMNWAVLWWSRLSMYSRTSQTKIVFMLICSIIFDTPDSKVHGANMGSTWVLSDPRRPHVGHMKIAIWDCTFWYMQVSCAFPNSFVPCVLVH